MIWLYRFLLIVALGSLGFVAGTIIGVPLVPANSGLAGPAIAMSYGLAGAVLLMIIGFFLAWRLAPRSLRQVSLICSLVALAAYIILPYLIISEDRVRIERQNDEPTQPPPVTVPQ